MSKNRGFPRTRAIKIVPSSKYFWELINLLERELIILGMFLGKKKKKTNKI